VLGPGAFPALVVTGSGVVAAWESGNGIEVKRVD
jgi:hypothetical protein